MKKYSAVLILFFIASCASQQPTATSSQVQAGAKPGAEALAENDTSQKRVCRKLERTGTHMKVRVCKTQKEWDEERKLAKDFMQDVQGNQKHIGSRGGGIN